VETNHEELFGDYVSELIEAKEAAEWWWKKLVSSERRRHQDPDASLASLRRRWPMGPASHPYVLAIIRKYWLACDELNEAIELRRAQAIAPVSDDEEPVSPPVFLCEFLLDGEHEKLAAFIAPLNYWPIGMDDDEDEVNG
jgi:hypothetical protein